MLISLDLVQHVLNEVTPQKNLYSISPLPKLQYPLSTPHAFSPYRYKMLFFVNDSNLEWIAQNRRRTS